MKKLIMIAALAVCAMGFSEVQAQKIIKDASGNVFLDMQDLPPVVFSALTLNAIPATTSSTTNSVYKKLQIAKADLPTQMTVAEACGMNTSYNSSSAIGQQQGTVNTGCKTYSAEGNAGKWRVPTHRELLMMFIMTDNLKAAGVTFSNKIYWTSAEWDYGNGMCVILDATNANGFGAIQARLKSTAYSVRCVREVN